MLHSRIRHLDQLVSVLSKWILAKIVLISFQHSLRLSKLLLGFVEVCRQRVKIKRQIAELIREMNVVADVQRNAVIVDWIMHKPIPASVAVPQIGLVDELSIGD